MRFHIQTSLRLIAGSIVTLVLTATCAIGQTQQPADRNDGSETRKAGTITGRVINENGQPLSNVSVWVRDATRPDPGQNVTTDRDGAFKVSGLQDNVRYSVFASMASYISQPREPAAEQNQYRVGDSVTLTLIKGGVLTGRVTTSAGDPVVTIGVRAHMIRDGNGRRITSDGAVRDTGTDDRGIYRLYGLPAGTYVVMAGGFQDYSRTGFNAFEFEVPTYAPSSTRDTAAEINVRAGDETEVDIRYRAEPGRLISGVVSGPTFADPGFDSGFNVILSAIADDGSQRNSSTYVHGTGEFVFTGLGDGDYYLTAQSSYARRNEAAVSDSKLIRVRGADVTGIELVTRPLGSVNGRVVLEEPKAIECKDTRPLVFTETVVAAWHKEQATTRDRARFVWSMGAPGKPDAQGNVTLRNLAPGDYRFVAHVPLRSFYVQSVSLTPPGAKTKPIDAARTWTTVKSGDRLSGLTIRLAHGAASLRGQLAVGEGETLPERSFVYLVPVEREQIDNPLRYFGVQLNPDGKFALYNLAPGRYWILGQPAIDAGPPPLSKLRWPDATEVRSTLRRAAEATKTEIELKPCQNVVDYRLPLTRSLQ